MPVYHRTQRLQIFGEKPEIQKLYGSRYRMVVRCVAKNDTKAWYDDNKDQIFADFGSLYSAQMSVDGIDARTGEAYDDMVLVKNEAAYTRSGEYVIVFTYETLTDSFVQETEDKVDFDLNGLKRLTRTIIAKDTVAYDSVVGTTTIVDSSPLLTLAQVSEDQLEASEDGFKRIQEVWLESGTLSETIDNVGSQKAKVIETIGADPATPSGYSLASKQESDFEGFQTNRFTFLKPSILSLQQDFNNGLKRVSVQAFGMTDANVSAELAAITTSHELMSQTESDYEGIKTSTFQYQIDEAFTEDYELNGLKRISIIELSTTNFTAQVIGGLAGITATPPADDPPNVVPAGSPEIGLYLGTQDIDNGGTIKVRQSVWLEPGELSRDVRSIGQGVQQTTHQFLVTEGTTVGDVISRDVDDFEGLKRITVSVIAKSDGTTLTNAAGAEKLNYSYQDLVPFIFPGVVDLQNNLGHVFPAVRSPVEAKVQADIYTYYQTSSDIVAGDFTKESSLGLWNPSEWCQKISTITSSLDNPAYFNAQGLRGCRTRDAFKLTGNLYGAISNNLKYISFGSTVQINSLELEETTEVLNGKSVYREVFRYTRDATRRLDLNVGGLGVNIIQTKSVIAKGTYTITMSWNGSQWVLSGTNSIIDPQPTETGTGDDEYVFSSAANGYLDTYTNRTASNTYTLFTSTNGANAPEDADWPAGVTAEAADNSEEFGVTSSPSTILDDNSVAANFGFIEGRVVEGGAYGNIRISGGPPNPLGKKYTLDVEVEKAFTKLDGTDVYRKTIVIATCTAV